MLNLERGFLSNWPTDVIAIINGEPVTTTDVLQAKRKRRRRQLELKRLTGPIAKPCFIWTFYNDTNIYSGWWLYIKTLKASWQIDIRYYSRLIVKLMSLFPCGYLPMIENFRPWMAAFASVYHYPTQKRPSRQGMVIARARVDSKGNLLDVTSYSTKEGRRYHRQQKKEGE